MSSHEQENDQIVISILQKNLRKVHELFFSKIKT